MLVTEKLIKGWKRLKIDNVTKKGNRHAAASENL